MVLCPICNAGNISIPALREEGDPQIHLCRDLLLISIPALREEGDNRGAVHDVDFQKFLSPPSARRATQFAGHKIRLRHISIPALREEGDLCDVADCLGHRISIPALREEGDGFREGLIQHGGISIPALREEGDARATVRHCWVAYFYPRPPRGGRLRPFDDFQDLRDISIPALREEGDP